MPQGDRTGPAGAGPMTGRGMGYCAGFSVPGFMNPEFGAGFRRGRGFRRGFRRMQFMQPVQRVPVAQPVELTKAEEKKILDAELQDAKADMQEIEKRLKELK